MEQARMLTLAQLDGVVKELGRNVDGIKWQRCREFRHTTAKAAEIYEHHRSKFPHGVPGPLKGLFSRGDVRRQARIPGGARGGQKTANWQ